MSNLDNESTLDDEEGDIDETNTQEYEFEFEYTNEEPILEFDNIYEDVADPLIQEKNKSLSEEIVAEPVDNVVVVESVAEEEQIVVEEIVVAEPFLPELIIDELHNESSYIELIINEIEPETETQIQQFTPVPRVVYYRKVPSPIKRQVIIKRAPVRVQRPHQHLKRFIF